MPGIDLIKQVILSWQVPVVAVAFLIYWAIVNAIVNPHKKHIKIKKVKNVKRPEADKQLDRSVNTDAVGLE